MAIKIPDQHYVTFQKRDRDDLPLGFMTPDGTDSAAQKRKSTAMHWAYRGGVPGENCIPPQTLENKLLIGFSLVQSIKRYARFGGGNVVWRIADPRGFELEISSANLAEIMRTSTIEKGEIQSRCIWGRNGADNVLIPEESELYQEAVKSTQLAKTTISSRDVKIGNGVVLQNGLAGIYYGAWYLGSSRVNLQSQYFDIEAKKVVSLESKTKYHLFCTEHFEDGSPKIFTAYATPKFASRTSDETFDLGEAERRIDNALNNGGSIDGQQVYGITFVADSLESINNTKISLREIDITDTNFMNKFGYQRHNNYRLIIDYYGVWAFVGNDYIRNNRTNPNDHFIFDRDKLLNGFFAPKVTEIQHQGWFYNRGRSYSNDILKVDIHDPGVKHYMMVLEIPSKYNGILYSPTI
jgi:hypothetical protein